MACCPRESEGPRGTLRAHSGGSAITDTSVLVRSRFSSRSAYQIGRHLRLIAKFVSDKRLVARDLSMWQSPFPRPASVRRTDSADDGVATALPSQRALDAVAEIFASDPQDPAERFVSAVWALLMCAPWRVSELLRLRIDAEYDGVDDDGVASYALRYFGAKGFGPAIKWIPKVMEPVAREAFRRLREMTESARALARHLETDPSKPFLYPDAPDVGVDDPLTIDQKVAYLRRPAPQAVRPTTPGWAFACIREHWDRARMRLPKGFPILHAGTGLPWSQALFCFHRNVLHHTRPVDWYSLSAPTANWVNDLLGASSIKQGVFARAGYKEKDGRPVRLNTHQARRYLSTVAERGTMAQEHLAEWAGRANVRDNRAYDCRSHEEMSDSVRDLLAGTALLPSKSAPRAYFPRTRAEFNTGVIVPTHRTEYGFCEHDWVASPCLKFRDCLNCSEHACVKGDLEALARVRQEYDQSVAECTKAFDALRAGAFADRWLEHALKSLVSAHELLSLLTSPDLEDGTAVRLGDGRAEYTHLRRSLERRLPQLRDPALPEPIQALLRNALRGPAPLAAARLSGSSKSWTRGLRGRSLTWAGLRERLRSFCLDVPSRQALARHGEISDAYGQAKDRLRTDSPVQVLDSLLATRVRRLEAQNLRLRIERLRLREQLTPLAVQCLQVRRPACPAR